MVAVFPDAAKERLLGSVPVKFGVPILAPIENDPRVPTLKLAKLGLVNTGAFRTVIG